MCSMRGFVYAARSDVKYHLGGIQSARARGRGEGCCRQLRTRTYLRCDIGQSATGSVHLFLG